jgi:hypothetical protein
MFVSIEALPPIPQPDQIISNYLFWLTRMPLKLKRKVEGSIFIADILLDRSDLKKLLCEVIKNLLLISNRIEPK